MFKRTTCNYAIRSIIENLKSTLYVSFKCRSKQSKFKDFLDQEVIEPGGERSRKETVTPPLVGSEG